MAGLDLEMPSSNGVTDAKLVAAVADGSLDESVLDTAADRMIDLVQKVDRPPRTQLPRTTRTRTTRSRARWPAQRRVLKNEACSRWRRTPAAPSP